MKTIARFLAGVMLACGALAAGAAEAQKAPRAGQSAGKFQVLTIKDQDGKEMLVRIDKESGATWVMRYGEYVPSPKGTVYHWVTVPCMRGDNQARC